MVEGPTTSKPKSTVTAPTDASNGDTDEEGFTSTQERLIQEADPERFDRTFRATDKNFRIGGAINSPSPFPLQTLPRLAYVINYNVVYNEDRERWEPQKKSSPEGKTVGGSHYFLGSNQTIPGNDTNTLVQIDSVDVDTLEAVELDNNKVQILEDGTYYVESHALLLAFNGSGDFDVIPKKNDERLIFTQVSMSGDGAPDTGVGRVVEALQGDTISLTVQQDSGSSFNLADGAFASYISIHQV